MESMNTSIRGRLSIASAAVAVAMLCCTSCNSHLKSSVDSPGKTGGSSSAQAHGAPPPLVRSRLAPGTVSTPAPGMHCHLNGTTPETYRPDPACNPGAVDDSVTQSNIDSTICVSGYTAKVRPPASDTDKVKRIMYGDYGIPDGTPSERDHLVSLELGGSNDARNLWIEPGKVPNPKDTVENTLHKAVCDHKVTLAAAQQAIAADWTTALAVTGAGK